jgi:hypothetical protein
MTTESKHNEGPWCNTCHGYTHMPWCISYEERLLTTVSNSDEWRVIYDGPSRPMIETSDGRLLSVSQFDNGRWQSYPQEEYDCAQIIADHHAAQTQSLLTDTLRLVQRLLRNQLDCPDALCRSCDDARRTVLATIAEVLGGEVERREGRRRETVRQ